MSTFFFAALIGGLACTAEAQWIYTSLHPDGARSSSCNAVVPGVQVGWADFGGNTHAMAWMGTAASAIDLHPAGSAISSAAGAQVDGNLRIVGSAAVGGSLFHASLWTGFSTDWGDLTPSGFTMSGARTMDGPRQGGYAYFSGVYHAGVWMGTAASWLDLHPAAAGATESQVFALAGDQQGGYTRLNGGPKHASLWSGTAASWTDLNPAGATQSEITAMRAGRQAGSATFAGSEHALLWSSGASDFADLTPANAFAARISAMSLSGSIQVGQATIGGVDHAGLWNNTSASWVDLHAVVSAQYSLSRAFGIWQGPGVIVVVGHARNAALGREEALMWTLRTCGSADFNCDGDVGTDADIESFFACLAGTCPNPPCTSTTDFDADGDIGTDADIEAFFRVLAGGSC